MNHTHHCIIVGSPVSHSLSPAMHTAAYQALHIDREYYFDYLETPPENLEETLHTLRLDTSTRGITVTMPHKEKVMKYIDVIDSAAEKIGAVNTIVVKDHKWYGYNTDWQGITTAVKNHIHDTGARHQSALVLGTGGAARSAIYALQGLGYDVTVAGRSQQVLERLHHDFGVEIIGFDSLSNRKKYDLIFNATSIGMGAQSGMSPLPDFSFEKNMIVFDAIYHPRDTLLLQEAKEGGATCIYGWEMLLYQAVPQFKLYTNMMPDIEVMRRILV